MAVTQEMIDNAQAAIDQCLKMQSGSKKDRQWAMANFKDLIAYKKGLEAQYKLENGRLGIRIVKGKVEK
jgi:hypothetical protein